MAWWNALYKQPRNSSRKHMRTTKISILEFILRNISIPGDGLSSTQFAHGASHRSIIPTKNTLLKPMAYDPSEVQRVLKKKKRPAQRKYFDGRYKSLEPRKRGDIRVRQGGTWEPAELLEKSSKGEPRSYIVRANDHRYRRNRKEILKRQETPLHEELVQWLK